LQEVVKTGMGAADCAENGAEKFDAFLAIQGVKQTILTDADGQKTPKNMSSQNT
jgi:hypothetical protein